MTDEATLPTGQSPQRFDKQITRRVKLDYLLFLPAGYHDAPGQTWPLILFLHGAGERGDDVAAVATHGVAKVAPQRPDFPFIVVSPQCPPEQWWDAADLISLLDDVQARLRADPDRVYLTGLSMGGFGTWELALRNPDRFAAIAPVCGGGRPYLVARIQHIPAWVFHGAQDDVVPLRESEQMAEALQACDADVRLTVYPDAGHDSWTETYDNPALYEWLLSHRRKK